MAAIQPLGLYSCDEELGAIGVFASIGHAHPPRTLMLQLEILIRKFVTINTFTSCAITPSEVAPLDHETLNNTVEGAPFVAKPFLMCSKCNKILHSLGHCLSKQADLNPAKSFPVRLNVKENHIGN